MSTECTTQEMGGRREEGEKLWEEEGEKVEREWCKKTRIWRYVILDAT